MGIAVASRQKLRAWVVTKPQIGLPETQLGIIPGWGGTQRLPALIGLRSALEIIVPGKALDAARALKIGLVDAVVLTPVPTEAVFAAGADVTVAVNLLGRETLPCWPGDDSPDRRVRPAGAARDGVVEALEVAQIDAAARQAGLADVPITPRFGPGTWRHFHLADRYLAAGSAAAAAALPALAALARPQVVARAA